MQRNRWYVMLGEGFLVLLLISLFFSTSPIITCEDIEVELLQSPYFHIEQTSSISNFEDSIAFDIEVENVTNEPQYGKLGSWVVDAKGEEIGRYRKSFGRFDAGEEREFCVFHHKNEKWASAERPLTVYAEIVPYP